MNLLTVEDMAASYGASQALFEVKLSLAPGEVLALMGRNGMGKTTTVRAICRLINSTGRLELAGRNLHKLPSHRVARLGLGLVPEGRRCFNNLTVRENLVAAARPGDWTLRKVGALFPWLLERPGQRADSLSGGEQQMLAIGRALMTNPRLLILDEATEGLAPLIRQEIWSAIARLKRESGMAIIVIDKSLHELGGISDHAVILERGKTVWQGRMAELSPEISHKYLGV
ncbi:MAG: ABC transporter ATP-binding protein [Rhodobacteraceae bacterium]|nr:ABC transporter ATP-binding protein [Paracoccaceae bacterium]